MQNGVDVQTLGDPLPVIVCFLEIICSHGLPNVKPHFLALVLKQNTEALLMWFLSHLGYTIFFSSYIVLSIRLHWFTVIMLVQYTFLEMQFNINALHTSRWIFTLLARKLFVGKYVSYICPLALSNCRFFHKRTSFSVISRF